ncbi:hypothetical protein N657DRAFT_423532 [Parathielavia appendiculata]|uniref:Uncharacterized protein n=1 Tax=Parathielavia appendiculata TaxID=2587402 RepID=A0AAN6TZT7_9PEZI|nr:hypothetical protein N657DRAFT_423532 [Parathielavia appendiculata]
MATGRGTAVNLSPSATLFLSPSQGSSAKLVNAFIFGSCRVVASSLKPRAGSLLLRGISYYNPYMRLEVESSMPKKQHSGFPLRRHCHRLPSFLRPASTKLGAAAALPEDTISSTGFECRTKCQENGQFVV